MGTRTAFSQVITAVRPLMQGTRKVGQLAAALVDMGLKQDSEHGSRLKSALELRAEKTWKGYANSSFKLPATLAGEIAGRWDSYRFADNLRKSYDEESLNDLAASLHRFDRRINKGNVGEGFGRLFYEVFKTTAGHTDAPLPAEFFAVDQVERSGSAYIDHQTNQLHVGDDWLDLPAKKQPPEQIQPHELGYVTALLHAYCEAAFKNGEEPDISDIPSRFQQHFQDQRIAFYSAEWVKELSWDRVANGRALFDVYLENMYQGVIDTNMRTYPNGVERLLETLKQSTSVQLDQLSLAQIVDLIDVWSRKGSCHELAGQHKLEWADQ